jgi:hypothetical protein
MSVGFLRTLVARSRDTDDAMERVYRLCREAQLKIEALNRQAEERRSARENEGAHA